MCIDYTKNFEHLKFQRGLIRIRLSSACSNTSCLACSKTFVNNSAFRTPTSISFSHKYVTSNGKVSLSMDTVAVL